MLAMTMPGPSALIVAVLVHAMVAAVHGQGRHFPMGGGDPGDDGGDVDREAGGDTNAAVR